MIYTSYFAKLKSLPENIIPISICGKAPDWYKGLQYKKLAPKYDFFMEWKKNHDNDYYIRCFNEQVLSKLNQIETITDLHMVIPREIREKMQHSVHNSPDWHIALICYEKPTDFCHRHLVSDWLNEIGLNCTEWKPDGEAKWVLPSQGQGVYPCNYQCSKCGYDSGARYAYKAKETKQCPGCNSSMK